MSCEQAAHLFHLDRQLCDRLLNTLVANGFLQGIENGSYGRDF